MTDLGFDLLADLVLPGVNPVVFLLDCIGPSLFLGTRFKVGEGLEELFAAEGIVNLLVVGLNKLGIPCVESSDRRGDEWRRVMAKGIMI